jgi:hypothetical protein
MEFDIRKINIGIANFEKYITKNFDIFDLFLDWGVLKKSFPKSGVQVPGHFGQSHSWDSWTVEK